MLNIEKRSKDSTLTIALSGRLDTNTAADLEKELKSSLGCVTALVFDFAALDYISSAGLRVLLYGQKTMSKLGETKVVHVNETITEIFEITGFSDILTIE